MCVAINIFKSLKKNLNMIDSGEAFITSASVIEIIQQQVRIKYLDNRNRNSRNHRRPHLKSAISRSSR